MKNLYNIYLSMICGEYNNELQEEYSEDILCMALNHYTTPFICGYYMNDSARLSQIKLQMKTIIGNYYLFEQFTNLITTLLSSNNIRYMLMKGIYISDCYPQKDIRKQSDVDIYIPNASDVKACRRILLSNGFTYKKEPSSHHLEFIYKAPYSGRQLILELHYRVTGNYQYAPANKVVNEVFSENALKDYSIVIDGGTYNVLPPTENAFYMLHHMLNHYMFSGFGIRLLYDYKAFLTRYNSEIDYARLKKWCKDSGIIHFYEIIIETLRQYLYLDNTIEADIHYDKNMCEYFIENILTGGDFGTNTAGLLINSTSYEKITFFSYFKEGHHQMKTHFKKLHKAVILWPILWAVTFVTFMKNNKRIRNASFSEIIHNFKTTNKRIQMIKIFEDK